MSIWASESTVDEINVKSAINLSNSAAIQDSGSDAITFDGSQNVTVPNGRFSAADAIISDDGSVNTSSLSVGQFAASNDAGSTGAAIAKFVGQWNGNRIGQISIVTGDDTTNKDEGDIVFFNWKGGSAAETMRLDQDSNVTVPNGNLTLSGGSLVVDANNINTDTTTGTEIGTSTSQKLGFFGATPVAQPTALTAKDTSTVDGTYGTAEQNVIQNNRTRIDELETRLQNLGLVA